MFDGGMFDGGRGWGMAFGWMFWLVALVVVVVLVSRVMGGGGSVRPPVDDPEAIIKARYARGEIGRDEYQERLADLRR